MKKILILFSVIFSLAACNDFLDRDPISSISPEAYFTDASQMSTYVLDMYNRIVTFPYTFNSADVHSDDKLNNTEEEYIFAPGYTTVGASGGDWNFTNIQRCNYFFQQVEAKGDAISGADVDNAKGEMYFLRAYEYFKKLKTLGDFPIITTIQDMNYTALEDTSKRAPRSTVARFILSDLDKAISLVSEVSADGGRRCRVNKDAVRLFKSRVALYEACWLKYFDGTCFVPNGVSPDGTEWPGKVQNPDFQYKAGSLSAEVDWLLQQSMDAAKSVIERHPSLTSNSGILPDRTTDEISDYFYMYACDDCSQYDEILFWKDYNSSSGVVHAECSGSSYGNFHTGMTRSLVESFLCSDGLPIYASNLYEGDDSIAQVMENRDDRLQLFMQCPGDTMFTDISYNDPLPESFMYSPLFHSSWGYSTGYASRKYHSYIELEAKAGGNAGDCGRPIFRSVEAYLNYMEASYMKNGVIDATASECWKKIRARAKVSEDYQKTIDHTDMSKEVRDWGSYSAGQQVDATLYNIRRERRDELASEYFRYDDLRRWRSMDQLITGGAQSPFIPMGFKLWGPMQDWYAGTLITSGTKQNVSSPDYSEYYCPYHVLSNHINYDGYIWTMAHYLTPIAASHFTMTSVSNETSTIYQNPYWNITAGSRPTSTY